MQVLETSDQTTLLTSEVQVGTELFLIVILRFFWTTSNSLLYQQYLVFTAFAERFLLVKIVKHIRPNEWFEVHQKCAERYLVGVSEEGRHVPFSKCPRFLVAQICIILSMPQIKLTDLTSFNNPPSLLRNQVRILDSFPESFLDRPRERSYFYHSARVIKSCFN